MLERHPIWDQVRNELSGLPDGRGLNIAHEAVDRHADGPRRDTIALRSIRADLRVTDVTYAELKAQTSRFANVLTSLGVTKGDRVFALTGRVPELYVAALGTLKNASVFCPMFSVFGPEPILQRMVRGDAKLLVTTTALFEKKIRPQLNSLPALRYVLLIDSERHLSNTVRSFPLLMSQAAESFSIPPTSINDPALLHFTSGTTGMPKGALHVHGAVLTHYATARYVLGLRDNDIFWCTADPGWVTGTSYGIIAPFVCGVTNIVDEAEFDAVRWYSILANQKVNVWYTAPTAIRRLMRLTIKPREVYDLHHLRSILSVGEPLHAAAVVWGSEMFGMPILDNWWQTETGGIMIANNARMPVRPGSMGKPLPGVEAAIAEVTDTEIHILHEPNAEGHLVLNRNIPSMFRTYLHDEERYAKCFRGDWYITGDLARCDKDGYYWFIGRADDIIKTSGHMVGPFEVESMLMRHHAVAEAAVIGKPDPLIGEMVKAFVVLRSGFTDSEELRSDILGFARKSLGPAVSPKELDVIDTLPKTRSGKILRRLLKARELGLPEGDVSTLEQG